MPASSNFYADGFAFYELDPASGDDLAIVAFATNLLIARATFDEVVKLRPKMALQLRHRARVICTAEGHTVKS